jgi:hypothetical protein
MLNSMPALAWCQIEIQGTAEIPIPDVQTKSERVDTILCDFVRVLSEAMKRSSTREREKYRDLTA